MGIDQIGAAVDAMQRASGGFNKDVSLPEAQAHALIAIAKELRELKETLQARTSPATGQRLEEDW